MASLFALLVFGTAALLPFFIMLAIITLSCFLVYVFFIDPTGVAVDIDVGVLAEAHFFTGTLAVATLGSSTILLIVCSSFTITVAS